MPSRIAGTGSYLPAQVLTNDDLARRVDTSDEWIRDAHRHPRSATSPPTTRRRRDLALARVARSALAAAGHRAGRRRPDHRRDHDARHDLSVAPPASCRPSSASRGGAGVRRAGGVLAASSTRSRSPTCSSRAGMARNALVVGAEIYSRILDWNDRGTCVLFGDGAGAVVLVPSATPGHPDVAPARRRQPRGHPVRAGPGVRRRRVAARRSCTWTAARCSSSRCKVLAEVGARRRWRPPAWPSRDIDWLIPHQANVRIMDATAKKLRPAARASVVVTVDRHGNTSAASIPLALDDRGARRPHPRRPARAAARRRRRLHLGRGASCRWS